MRRHADRERSKGLVREFGQLTESWQAALRTSCLVLVAALVSACGSPSSPQAATPTSDLGSPIATVESPSPSPSQSPGATAGTIDLASLTGRIAFSGGGRHAEDVYVVDANGGNLRRVTSDPASDFDPSWAPDGARLAYRHQTGLDPTSEVWVIDSDGQDAHDISNEADSADWGPSWSPDGKWIAWNSQQGRAFGFKLALVAPDGSGLHLVPVDRWVEYPAWSPDGTRIAFMSQQPDASGNDPNYDVYVVGVDGSGLTQLTEEPGEDGFPAWSPDGNLIAFSSSRDDCRNSTAPDCLTSGDIGPYQALYVMKPDGSAVRRVSSALAMLCDWSPDGRYLVAEARGGLGVYAVDGTGNAIIPVSVSEPGFPDWLP
jgi:Tol biopolymer transport system component